MNRPVSLPTSLRTPLLGALAVALAGGLTVLSPTSAAAAPFGPSPERLAEVTAHGGGVVLGGRLLFPAQDSTHGVELWSTDGTAAGTRMVTDLRPGAAGSNVAELVVLGDRVYFRADDGVTGSELWSTDGTAAGTDLVHDVVPGGNSSAPIDLTVAGPRVYFTAFHPGFGRELWASTGSTTYLVADLQPGLADGRVGHLTPLAGRLLFAGQQVPGATKPWVTSGTTVERLDAGPDNQDLEVGDFEVLGDRAVFAAGDERSGQELWVTGGQARDAYGLRDIEPGGRSSAPFQLTRSGDQVYFSAHRGAEGRELWTTDGTAGGTQQVRDVREGPQPSAPLNLTPGSGFLAFTADDGSHGAELWVTRGTPAGTVMPRDVLPGAGDGVAPSGGSLAAVGGQVFFGGRDAGGDEPWLSDGTTGGTRRIADLTPGAGASSPRPVGVLGNTIVFGNLLGTRGLWAYTVTGSRTLARPKASYSPTRAKQRRIVVPVRVEGGVPRPTGEVTLTAAGRVVGRATLVDGVARVRITVRLRAGRHRLVAAYAGSPDAGGSRSVPFVVRVRSR